MASPQRKGRTDTAARIVEAQSAAVYRAFVDTQALAAWLPPRGMKAQVEAFDPLPGGAFRITLTWLGVHDGIPGKTTRDADTVQGRFGALVPGERPGRSRRGIALVAGESRGFRRVTAPPRPAISPLQTPVRSLWSAPIQPD